jgi:ketosteroid isomerase-like protein
MKSSCLLLIAAFLFSLHAQAGKCEMNSVNASANHLTIYFSANNDSEKIIELENSWTKALVKQDEKTFEKLLATGFVYSENDQTFTREEVLKELQSGNDKVELANNEDLHVYLFAGTAIVTGWMQVKGKNADGSFEHRYRFTDTWMKIKGGWQLIGAHDYIAPK